MKQERNKSAKNKVEANLNTKEANKNKDDTTDNRSESKTQESTTQFKAHFRFIYYLLPCIFLSTIGYIFMNHNSDNQIIYITALAAISYFITIFAINSCMESHKEHGFSGVDLNKGFDPKTGPRIPESMGLESSAIMVGLVIITTVFLQTKEKIYRGLISIILTTFLGFADDVLNIRWRVKILIPFFSVLPLILDYDGPTTICLKGILSPLHKLFNFIAVDNENIDIGYLYLIYIFCLFVFCTHSINIYAGINGLEVGQSLITAIFLLYHASRDWETEEGSRAAVYLLVPFIFTTYALLYSNWFPSKVFVGDTFTLTAGAVIATAGILSHSVEMTLLFMMPELINFTLSFPQLIGIVKCPRHRLPTYNPETKKLVGQKHNLNLVNYWLILFGPKNEERLFIELLFFQILCCVGALGVRHLYLYS